MESHCQCPPQTPPSCGGRTTPNCNVTSIHQEAYQIDLHCTPNSKRKARSNIEHGMWPFLTSLTSFSLSARKGSGAHFLSEGICLHLTFTSYALIQTNGSTADPILVQTNPPNTLFRLICHGAAHCPQQASHQSSASPQNLIQNQVT